MQTDSLFNQPSARKIDLRYGTLTQESPINTRRPPFDTLTIGLHCPIRQCVVARAR